MLSAAAKNSVWASPLESGRACLVEALARDSRLIWVNLCSYVEVSTSLRAVKLEDEIARPLIAHIAHAVRFSRRIKNGPARPQRLA